MTSRKRHTSNKHMKPMLFFINTPQIIKKGYMYVTTI